MKQKFRLLPALIAILVGMPAAAQQTEKPIFTFKTTLYDNAGASNAFHFNIGAKANTYLDIDFGFGKTEVEIEQATFDETTSAIKATTVTGSVGEEGIVKVYGDASLIDYLDLEGVYITDLEISALTNLEILNVSHNELKALDLTPFTKLQALYLTDNPFDVKPVIIGKDKPNLTILEMSIVGALDQSFNLSDYPQLASFDAYSTFDLRELDPTGCPELLKLSIDCTSVATLDVSKNPKLLILDIAETAIVDIDLSNNIYLTEFYCTRAGAQMGEYKFDSLDVTMLPNLQRLFCQDNNLTELDVSKNPLLTDLFCNGNRLTTIDLSNNPNLIQVNISNNNMDFTTMPLPRETFIEYLYYQRNFPVARSFPVNTTLDFSSKVIVPDSETWFALFATQRDEEGVLQNVELTDDYYKFEDGKVTLLKSSPDSLYMAFANSLFPDYDIQTTKFMVKEADEYGKDNVAVTFRPRPATKQIFLSVGIQGASPENPKKFSVDFGNGQPVEFTTTTNVIPAEPNASAAKAGNNLTIYTPEGTDMSALAMNGIGLVSINVDGAPCLTDLSLTGCQLNNISTPWNRLLVNLDLSNNNLTSLDISGGDDINHKGSLRNLKVSDNKLSEFAPALLSVTHADFSNNRLVTFNLGKASKVIDLNLSNNLLTGIDIKDLESIEKLNLSGNNLSEILIPDYVKPAEFNLSMNRFPLSTLPRIQSEGYVYAPQKPWALPVKAPTVNLTSQLFDSEAGQTTFNWYKADGTPITGDGIKENVSGVFQLLDTELGLVYCTFSNPAFPDLSGENIYRTSDVEVAEMPTKVICSFLTLSDCDGELVLRAKNDNIPLYIEWEGNGALYEFMTGTALARYDIRTTSNSDVKVYSYSDDAGIDVFSLTAGPLGYFDASHLSELVNLSLYDSKLAQDKMTLPAASALTELVINNGDLTSLDFIKGKYPLVKMINLSGNRLTEADFSEWKELEALFVSDNELSEVKFDNPKAWGIALGNNKLTEVDLSKLPALLQLSAYKNNLRTIDFSNNPQLKMVDICENYFDFNTLPDVPESVSTYYYGNQETITPEVKDGHIVDLSGYGATTFRWFIDSPYFDDEGNLTGEELIIDKEYTFANGVTDFLKNFTHIMCVMQNPTFPDLYLCTDFINVRVESSIEEISASDNAPSGIYDLQGRKVTNPGHGIFIVNGKKVVL